MMHRTSSKRSFALQLLFFLFFYILSAQTGHISAQTKADSLSELMKKAIRVYLDCSCDEQFMHKEMQFINFVRDRNEADVHILITTQTTGSGGSEYTVTFIGKQGFTGLDDTLLYHSQQTDTDDMIRNGLLRTMKLGLMHYVAKSPLADKIAISYTSPDQSSESVKDAWDYWLFTLSINGNVYGQKSNHWRNFNGNVSAVRTTPDLKVNLSIYLYDYKSRYDVDDTTRIESYSGSKSFYGLTVFSLNDHWSTGISTSLSSSTYSNNYFSFGAAPAIEYDLFPYSEATHQQLRFLEKIGVSHVKYYEETIYEKTSQTLPYQDLSIALDVKEPWGTISTSIEGSNYFYDFKKNRIQLNGSVSLRIIEGLSGNISGYWSGIHDQLGLRKGTATSDDVLLQQRQLETQYEFYFWFGISYSFGSIFNNVVNPRFGS